MDSWLTHAVCHSFQYITPNPGAYALTGPTLAVAGWLLVITTLSAATWSPTDVLYLYRARWQVELVFKK